MWPVPIKPLLESRLQPVLGVHNALQPEGEDIWTSDSSPRPGRTVLETEIKKDMNPQVTRARISRS